MSTERATLSDFATPERTAEDRREERREAILAEGGVYGRFSTGTEAPDRTPEQVCLRCGREIPTAVARVVGDNDGNVPCCDQCRVGNGNEPYTRISKAVRCYRAGSGKWADGGRD